MPPLKVRLPNQLDMCHEEFKSFYNTKHKGRKLNWILSQSRGEVAANCFKPKVYRFLVRIGCLNTTSPQAMPNRVRNGSEENICPHYFNLRIRRIVVSKLPENLLNIPLLLEYSIKGVIIFIKHFVEVVCILRRI